MKTNLDCVRELTDLEVDYQIHETVKELRGLDRHSASYDAAVDDLRDLFFVRRERRDKP